jgi:protein-L-isoaspartate O-methyltransferase
MPDALVEGLREGAILVAPVGPTHDQRLLRYTRSANDVAIEDLGAVRFVAARPLITG